MPPSVPTNAPGFQRITEAVIGQKKTGFPLKWREIRFLLDVFGCGAGGEEEDRKLSAKCCQISFLHFLMIELLCELLHLCVCGSSSISMAHILRQWRGCRRRFNIGSRKTAELNCHDTLFIFARGLSASSRSWVSFKHQSASLPMSAVQALVPKPCDSERMCVIRYPRMERCEC